MASSSAPDEPQVEVRFTTRLEEHRVTDAPIQLPTRLTRAGLSEVVNHLLGSEHTPRPFDFLLEGTLLRGSLARGLERHGLSGESAAVLEYIECVPPPQPENAVPHDDWVSALAAQPGGGALLSTCYNNEAYVWDAAGKRVAALVGHVAPVKAGAWLRPRADGLRVATGAKDELVRTWRVAPGGDAVCEAVGSGHEASVEAIAANPGGEMLCSGGWDGSLKLWETGEAAVAAAAEAAAEADGAPASKKRKGGRGGAPASVSASAPIELEPSGELKGHAGSVAGLCWPTAALVYSASWDGTVREWGVATRQQTACLSGQPAALCIDVSLAASLVATGHTDHAVRLWDARLQGQALRLTLPHKAWASGVRWCEASANLLATSSYDGSVQLWDVRSTVPLHRLPPHEGKALCVAWDGEGRLVSGGSDGQLRVAAVTLPAA